MRNPHLTEAKAPYRVEFRRQIRWEEAQQHMLWLVAQENQTEGFFHNGRGDRTFVTGDRQIVREYLVWYMFTDENTAFLFKLHFG
jgi:hypothetical protein